jgi:TolB-like protein
MHHFEFGESLFNIKRRESIMKKAKRLGISSFSIIIILCSVQVALAQSELAGKVEELADKLTSSISGEVASVEGDIIYMNLGEKDCVYEGSQFEVVRLGEVVMVGNKPIHKERPIGEIQITKVRKDMSLAKTTTSFAQIEKGDKVYQKRKKVTRIALTEFPYGENLNNLTKNIYESLSVSFSQKGMQVVERSQLEKVLQEQKISYSGVIDINTAQKLGQMLGTEAIVLGTATDSGNNVAIRARLVDVGKGVVITAAQVEVMKNPEIVAMLDAKTRTPQRTAGTSSATGTSGKSEKEEGFFENDFIRIEVVSFKQEAEGLLLKLKFINRAKKPFSMILSDGGKDTYLVDDLGNQYPCKEGELMQRGSSITFPPNAPRISTIVFRNQKEAGNEFTFSARFITWDVNSHGLFASISGLRIQ